jgi:hypothetical protein
MSLLWIHVSILWPRCMWKEYVYEGCSNETRSWCGTVSRYGQSGDHAIVCMTPVFLDSVKKYSWSKIFKLNKFSQVVIFLMATTLSPRTIPQTGFIWKILIYIFGFRILVTYAVCYGVELISGCIFSRFVINEINKTRRLEIYAVSLTALRKSGNFVSIKVCGVLTDLEWWF